MNEPIFSPEETQALNDALLAGAQGHEAQAVMEIDLTGGERPLRAAQPLIDKMGGQLAAAWRRTLATSCRFSAEVMWEPSEIITFRELRRTLEAGTTVGRLEAVPSAAPVLLLLGAQFGSVVLDYGFGGTGEDNSSLRFREPTTLERNFLRRLCILLASDVTTSLREEALELSFLHLEGKSDFSTLMPEGTALLLVPFKLRFAGVQDYVSLAFTVGAVDSISRPPTKEQVNLEAAPDSNLVHRLQNWPLTVSAELGHCSLTVGDILELTPGTVLRLESLARDPVPVLLNGMPKLIGRPIVSDGGLATQIERWIETDSAEEVEERDVEQTKRP